MTITTGVILGVLVLAGTALLYAKDSELPTFDPVLFDRSKNLFVPGVYRQGGNKLVVQLETEMPGVSPYMIAFWFEDYMQTTAHYQRWYPDAHLWMDWEHKIDGEIIGAHHLVDEYIGERLSKLRIEFVDPTTLIPGYQESPSRYAVCALPGPRILPLTAGIMCHDTQATESGNVMRTIFYMGHFYHRDYERTVTSLMPALLNRSVLRNIVLGESFGHRADGTC